MSNLDRELGQAVAKLYGFVSTQRKLRIAHPAGEARNQALRNPLFKDT